MKHIQNYCKKILFIGVFNSFRCLWSRVKLGILRLFFDFNPWHVTSSYECRPYKSKIIDALESLPSNGVIEIGCGLGDICTLLGKRNSILNYHGFDIDFRTISAAKFLSKNKDIFSVGSFESINTLDAENYNTLLALNWPHEICPHDLTELVMLNITENICFFMIDVIHPNASMEFEYKHSASELIDCGLQFRLVRVIKHVDNIRDLLIFER